MATRKQVVESLRRLEELKREMGIIPRLKLVICNPKLVFENKKENHSFTKMNTKDFQFCTRCVPKNDKNYY